MRASHRAALFALALAGAACGPRQAEVRTAPSATREQSVQVTNNLSQAVNVYVTPSGGPPPVLRDGPPNPGEKGPGQGVASRTPGTVKGATGERSRAHESGGAARPRLS